MWTCEDWDSIQWILAKNNSKVLKGEPINLTNVVDDSTVLLRKIRELRVCARLSSPNDILNEDVLNYSNNDKAHNLASSGYQCGTNVDPNSSELFLTAAHNIPQCSEDKQPLVGYKNKRDRFTAICTKRKMDFSIQDLHDSFLKLRDDQQEAMSETHCGTFANHPVVDKVNSEDACEIVKHDSDDASIHKSD